MFLTHLSLTDFRSYRQVEVPLEAGVTVFTGANGQGKTNLVEAVEFLATLGSHRVATEAPLIRHGADRAVVRARVQAGLDDQRSVSMEIELVPGRPNRAALNRAALSRPRDLLGLLRVVIFSPEDLAIVKGDPADRRRFVDELLTARWPRMAAVRSDYERVLKQRTALLKSLSGRNQRAANPEVSATLDVWDAQLAGAGAELVAARLTTIAALEPLLKAAYSQIAPGKGGASAAYKSSLQLGEADPGSIAEQMIELMQQRRNEEIARGVCLIGPHRDEVGLSLAERPAKGYASHGESWSLALALKLASFALLRTDGVEPVLILDDVFAELDENRRQQLADLVADAEQVLITAAVAADVPSTLTGRRYVVEDGSVEESGESRSG